MLIAIDSPYAQALGFTSDKFIGYLDERPINVMNIPLIESRQRFNGDLSRFLDVLSGYGYTVRVVNPSVTMRSVLRAKGFVRMWSDDPVYFGQDIMEKR